MFGHPIYWNNRTIWWQFKFFKLCETVLLNLALSRTVLKSRRFTFTSCVFWQKSKTNLDFGCQNSEDCLKMGSF